MKKTLFAAIVAISGLFALPAGAAADGIGGITVVVKQTAAPQWRPVYGRPAHRHVRPYGSRAWRQGSAHFHPRQRVTPRFGHRVVRPYRPYRFVYRFY